MSWEWMWFSDSQSYPPRRPHVFHRQGSAMLDLSAEIVPAEVHRHPGDLDSVGGARRVIPVTVNARDPLVIEYLHQANLVIESVNPRVEQHTQNRDIANIAP